MHPHSLILILKQIAYNPNDPIANTLHLNLANQFLPHLMHHKPIPFTQIQMDNKLVEYFFQVLATPSLLSYKITSSICLTIITHFFQHSLSNIEELPHHAN